MSVGTHQEAPQEHATREKTPWFLAVLCLLVPALPHYLVLPGPLKGNGSPARLIAFSLAALMVLGFLTTRRSGHRLSLNPGIVIVLLYLAANVLVYGIGISHTLNTGNLNNASRYLIVVVANVGLALFIMRNVNTDRQRRLLLGCLAVALTFNCTIGLLQQFTSVNVNFILRFPGLVETTNPEGGSLAAAVHERYGAKRSTGTSGHAIEFSVLAATLVPLAMHFSRYASSRTARTFSIVALSLAVISVPSGVSRSGLIALTVAIAVYVWALKLKHIALIVAGGVAGYFFLLATAPNMLGALWKTIINSPDDASVGSRLAGYAKVSSSFQQHPFFGIGFGGDFIAENGLLDNEWLGAIVDGGIVGFLWMCLLVLSCILGMAVRLRVARSDRERDEAYALGAMLLAIMASSFTFDLLGFPQATFVLFILIGLVWSGYSISGPRVSTAAGDWRAARSQ